MLNYLAFGLGGQELIILLVIVLLFFGGAKIPQLMRGLGRGVGEFQEGLKDTKNVLDSSFKGVDSTSSSSSRRAQSEPAPTPKETETES